MNNKVIVLILSLAICLAIESRLSAAAEPFAVTPAALTETQNRGAKLIAEAILGNRPEAVVAILSEVFAYDLLTYEDPAASRALANELNGRVIEFLLAKGDESLNSLNNTAGQQFAQLMENIMIPSGESQADLIKYWTEQPVKTMRVLSHPGAVVSVAFSPNDTQLASVDEEDPNIRLWDLNTGTAKLLRSYTKNMMGQSAVFSPDGNTLVSWSVDCTLNLWDVNKYTMEHLIKFGGILNGLKTVVFSHDGKLLVIERNDYQDKTFTLWEIQPSTGEKHKIQPINLIGTGAKDIALSSDGKTLAYRSARDAYTGYEGNLVYLLDLKTGPERADRIFDRGGASTLPVFSHNGILLAVGFNDGTLRLWNCETNKEIQNIFGMPTDYNYSIAFSPDDKILASGSRDGTIRLWNVKTGELIKRLEGHTDGIISLEFSHDGKMLASGSNDKTIRLWGAAR